MTKKNPHFNSLAVTFVLALTLPLVAFAAFPPPAGPVSDFAGILRDDVRAELLTLIRDTEAQTTAEIAVVTVGSLDGMSVEEYANRLFHEWGIGQKGSDNGVLVLVAPTERKMRIEVGYGLEPVLPDGLAGEIIRTDFLPKFKADDYNRGVLDGVKHVARIVRRGTVVSDAERQRLLGRNRQTPSITVPAWVILPFLGVFVALGALGVGVGARTKTIMPILFGTLFSGFPLFIGLLVARVPASLTLVPLAMGMTVLGYRKGRQESWRDAMRSSGDGPTSDGWVMGTSTSSSGSSDGSSSSSGSDNFSGGDSGGGGASGSW